MDYHNYNSSSDLAPSREYILSPSQAMSIRRSPVTSLLPNFASTLHTASIESQRITPRNSDGDKTIAAAAANETPYGTLRQLANMPRQPSTPLRRASSAGPPYNRSFRRTPSSQARTLGGIQRLGGSARRPSVLTPHGRAAMRELAARRAGFTPAKDRRRSGRQQRETPRDTLRALSRVLAPKTQPVMPTPQIAAPAGKFTLLGNDVLDDGVALERPRLSLALENHEDEDDSLLLPPRSTGLEDDNLTSQSMELPRRAISEQPRGRLSRGSLGSIRMDDQLADLSQGTVFDSSFAIGGPFVDDILDMDVGPREETVPLRDLSQNRGRFSLASGGDSDIQPQNVTEDDTENTFVFTLPQREMEGQQDEQMLENSQRSTKRQILQGSQESRKRDEHTSSDWDENEEMNADELDEIEEVEMPELSLGSTKRADLEMNLHNTTPQNLETSVSGVQKTPKKKKIKVSKHGIPYPSLPAGVVKKLATTYARTSGKRIAKISKDTLDAIVQASDWFFEQISDDLDAYARHAGRKTIDESDLITLMRRQRQTSNSTTPFSLAQRHLPRELLQELRMIPLLKLKKGKQRDTVGAAVED